MQPETGFSVDESFRHDLGPGEIGYSYEDDPEKVQIAQPHSLRPLRINPHSDGVEFPSPHIQVDAHIGDSPSPARRRTSNFAQNRK